MIDKIGIADVNKLIDLGAVNRWNAPESNRR